MKHLACIERLGLVGDSKWEAGMAAFCEPYTTATRRFFDEHKAGESLKWINGEIA